ncbi:DUF6573 family protein [Cohnella soli]|uniref:DUF6573 family protein n=1 Tax=Cohnella soli TaxID=425005 RepID=A0ABW0HN65_9BACL
MHMDNENVISRYTRGQALEDGQLVDISNYSRRVGILFPVAVTHAVDAEVLGTALSGMDLSFSRTVQLGRFLVKLREEMRKGSGDRIDFEHAVETKDGSTKTAALYATLLPGDDLEPVITVLLVSED